MRAAQHPVWGWEGANSSKGSLLGQRGNPCLPPAVGAHHHPLEPASPSPGTRHFLLFCGVRPEDVGLVRFVAGMVVSEANLRVEGTGAGCEGWPGPSTRAGVHQGQLVGS